MAVGNETVHAIERLYSEAYSRPSWLRTLLLGNRFQTGLVRFIVNYALLVLSAFLFFLPFFWMVNTALKPPNQVFTLPPTWIPKPVMWSNFLTAFTIQYETDPPVYNYALNTAIVTVNGVVSTIFSSALVAYAFARLVFPGKNVTFMGNLSTLMIPFAVVMVPQFIIWRYLNWLDAL